MLEHAHHNRKWRNLEKVLIKDCGTSKDIKCIHMNVKFRLHDAYKFLVDTQYQVWPVVQDHTCRRLRGVVTRKGLEHYLRHHRMLSHGEDSEWHTGDIAIDISSVMEEHPHVMWNGSTFIEAFNVFRSLQLRMLCIVDEHYRLCCIVTRNDLAEVIEEKTNEPIMQMRDHCEQWNVDDDDEVLSKQSGRLSYLSRLTASIPGSHTSAVSTLSHESHAPVTVTSSRALRGVSSRALRRSQRRRSRRFDIADNDDGLAREGSIQGTCSKMTSALTSCPPMHLYSTSCSENGISQDYGAKIKSATESTVSHPATQCHSVSSGATALEEEPSFDPDTAAHSYFAPVHL